jgi:glycosyltransferase involved in cell wall biosynthesis
VVANVSDTVDSVPLTVCLVAREEADGSGVRRYVDRLDAGLGQRGVNVVRLGTTPRGALSRVLDAARHIGADVNTFLSRYPVRLAWPPADVYHLTGHTYAAALAVSPPPGPTIVTVHDIGPFLLRDSPRLSGYGHRIHRWFDSVAIHALANVDEILSVSEWTRRTLIESAGLPEDRITVTLLGVDHAQFRPFQVPRAFRERYGLPDGRPLLVYVGNDEPRKNLETIWRALPIIRQVVPEVVLLKVGPSPIPSRRLGMRQLAIDIGIADAIRFIDDVPDADLPSFYNLADVVLIPSLYEGFGLPALEALACARPVVISSAPALIEVTGDAATVVDARDASGLATATLDLLSDPAAAQELGQRGRERSMQFAWPLTVDRTIEVYRRVSASANRTLGSSRH